MPEVIEAIYAQGVFKPLQALDILDGQHVRLVIETSEVTPTEEILALAAQVYEGLSPADVEANKLPRSKLRGIKRKKHCLGAKQASGNRTLQGIETITCKRDDVFGEATS